jgi:4-hydroxy-2-oxoheptanedioate aldolase
MKNHALDNWKNQIPSPGVWINLPEIHTAELIARMDIDWLCFDLQHGLMTEPHLLGLIPAISATKTTPLVRVTRNDPGQIGRALDLGALVPMVNTAEEARQAAACRYPPDGTRSCGPMRGIMLDGMEYLATANQEIACIVMIETSEGLQNVSEIAATDGVDALFIGPIDLCYGLGLAPGDFGAESFVEAVQKIKTACGDANCALGLFGYTPELAAAALQDGFQFASIGTDIGFFRQGAEAALAITTPKQGSDKKPPSAGY